jgi:hypothetical protein
MSRKSKSGLPRHVSAKQIKDGIAYYWTPPTWARPAPMVARLSVALGRDLAEAAAKAEVLNGGFDHWTRRALGIVPNGYLSNVVKNEI